MKKALFIAILTSAHVAWASPLSLAVLTAGDESTNVLINGGVVTTFSQAANIDGGGSGNEYAVAFTNTIQTLGNGNQGGSPTEQYSGAQYLANGTQAGVNYAYPLASGDFYDGATNGVNDFSVDYDTGNVYSFGLDWSNPTLLFTAQTRDLGITYDPVNQSLWISDYGGTNVRDYSLNGTLLSSFTAQAAVLGLAMDYADDTLWADNQGTLYQYSRTGTELSTFNDGLELNTLGFEFQFQSTPEPGTAFLGIAGLAALGFMRNRVRARK